MKALRSLSLLMLAAVGAGAQTYSDQGLTGSSGIILFPTSTIAPKAQFRFQAGRMSFLGGGLSGVNVIGISGGLSSHVEAYVRLHDDQSGSSGAVASYGFGAKLQVPFAIPVVEELSLWGESVTTESLPAGSVYPTDLVRTGVTTLLIRNGVKPQVMVGVTFIDHRTTILGGAGVTFAASRIVQLGAEVLYGYAGSRSIHAMGSGAIRLVSGLCLQVGVGHLSTPERGTGLLSVGLSFGTADVDFAPVVEEKRPDFRMPTLEEMEQDSREEEKQ